jgi:hypothetical protein
VRAGEIVVFDKAYVDFAHLADLAKPDEQEQRGDGIDNAMEEVESGISTGSAPGSAPILNSASCEESLSSGENFMTQRKTCKINRVQSPRVKLRSSSKLRKEKPPSECEADQTF